MNKPLKVVFIGTPAFSVPYLKSLIGSDLFEVKAVITQPDKPTGRQQIITSSPVKITAQVNNLLIFQPEKLKADDEIIEPLRELEPDFMVVVAYGQIIPTQILALAKLGNINVHPSILPKYRGASPIQNAILNQEKSTGLTIMLMDEKMDHGPILTQKEISLDGTETNESLHQKMSDKINTDFLLNTLIKFANGEITPQAQDDNQATYCKQIAKEEARINWHQSARKVSAQIRAFYPWPATWTTLNNKRVKIFPPISVIKKSAEPGKIFLDDKKLAVACQLDALLIDQLQIEGKNKAKAKDFLAGHQDIRNQSFK